jgi:cell division protease FtsH
MGARAGRWIIEIFIVLMLLISLFNLFKTPYAPPPPGLAFSEFLGDVDQGKIVDVTFLGNSIIARYKDGNGRSTHLPSDIGLVRQLMGKGVTVIVTPGDEAGALWTGLVLIWLPLLIMIWFLWRFISRPLGRVAGSIDRIALGLENSPAKQQGNGPGTPA